MLNNYSQRLFHPSGLNNQFSTPQDLPFADYIQQTRKMIAKARIDLTPENTEKILAANTPFELGTNANKQGILLLHGLFDCPFMLRDLGEYFASQGLLVRSILLPGMGTVPGDLLDVHNSEWLKAVDYGVTSLKQEVEQVFIAGFSLGGVLALHKALSDSSIAGLILIAPALALPYQSLIGSLIWLRKYIPWAFPGNDWYKKRNFQQDYTKYESYCYNAADQIYQLISQTHHLLQKNTNYNKPIFLAISADDEVVSPQACLDLFKNNQNTKSQLWWYTKNVSKQFSDPRIIFRNSVYPNEKILDFSHICLPISPNNFHYGRQGNYRDFLQYPNNLPPENAEIFLGATNRTNCKQHVMQRLSYNPDFASMAETMRKFLLAT